MIAALRLTQRREGEKDEAVSCKQQSEGITQGVRVEKSPINIIVHTKKIQSSITTILG